MCEGDCHTCRQVLARLGDKQAENEDEGECQGSISVALLDGCSSSSVETSKS